LISVRWEQELFGPFTRFFEQDISHPGLVSPVDVFFERGVLCSVTPWSGESFLLDEASPLPTTQVLDLAQRSTGIIAFLQKKGVQLTSISAANFLVTTNQDERHFVMFDPDISGVLDREVSAHESVDEVRMLGGVLRRMVSAEDLKLSDFFRAARQGNYPSPMAFGRALEQQLKSGLEDPLSTHIGAMSDVGLTRSLNEDNWGWTRLYDGVFLYVVADGMGGHDKGEVASQMAVDVICQEARGRLQYGQLSQLESLENILDESFQCANNSIKDHSEMMGSDMGTTMTAALIQDNRVALVANVGDSRAYLMREQVLHQISRDHSLVARMVEQNRLTPEQARNHPHSNILLRTVGTDRNVEIDIFRVDLEEGDVLVLCSDGLWGEIEDEDIEAILNNYPDPRISCREMVRAAKQGGGKDNITVVVVGF